MEYKYFTLDKNPKQFKRISIGEYSIELRIEWNTRSKAWYVLGYSGDEIVISNVKMTPNQLYSIDIDSEYDLPYMIGIVPKYTNYDWDTETTFLIVDNPLSNAVEGLTVDGGVIKRSIATSSDTHSRKALKGTENKYLFDVVSITQETGITIVCNGADASFKTVNLPQGRWDFTINGLRTITADTEAFRSLMNDYGVQIVDIGNNEYLFSNNSNQEIKIEGLYPYAAGYDFNVVESSNESAKIHSVDNNGWVNRFTVCLVPASSLIWTITSGEVSSDYQYVNFTGEKSVFESTAKLSTTQALAEKYRGGLDPYSATIVNELTGVSDWVLDSANNQIRYTVPTGNGDFNLLGNFSTTMVGAANSVLSSGQNPTLKSLKNCQIYNSEQFVCFFYLDDQKTQTAPVYGYYSNVQEEEKTLPLPVVAQKVISNAESGDVAAQQVALSTTLEKPLVRSLSSPDMQQWQAVKDAIGQLTGLSSWTFDNVNKVVKCVVYEDVAYDHPSQPYYYVLVDNATDTNVKSTTPVKAADKYFKSWAYWSNVEVCTADKPDNPSSRYTCTVNYKSSASSPLSITNSIYAHYMVNPTYVEGTAPPSTELSITYQQVADKIIDNSNVADQGISLLAETYITEALLKFTDIDSLISQFEANKQPK